MAKGRPKEKAGCLTKNEGKAAGKKRVIAESSDKNNETIEKQEQTRESARRKRNVVEPNEGDPLTVCENAKDSVSVDQGLSAKNHEETKNVESNKQSRKLGRKKSEKLSTDDARDPNKNISKKSKFSEGGGRKKTTTSVLKTDIKQTKAKESEVGQKSNMSCRSKEMSQKSKIPHPKAEHVLKSEDGENDEIDGDFETSEYFSSDSGKNQGSVSKVNRKRKYSGEKKSMSSKVKHLNTHSPALVSKSVSKVRLIKSDENDSSDSDFEEVPDIQSSPVHEAHKKIKKESDSVENEETVTKAEKIKTKVKTEVKSRAESDPSKKNMDRRKKKTDKESTHDSVTIKRKKKYKEIPSTEEISSQTTCKKRKLDNKIKPTKNKGENEKTVNSKTTKGDKRKQIQKTAKTHKEKLNFIDHSDVTALLLHMEGPGAMVKPSTSYAKDNEDVMSDDDDDDNDDDEEEDESEEDWEDVEDHHHSPLKSQLPDKPVEITLEAPVIYKKRKKREFDIKAFFQKQINKYKKELNISMHKVHLLCLLARGFYLNNLCLDETLEAQAMSVAMTTWEPSPETCSINDLLSMISWMISNFPVNGAGEDQSTELKERLENSFNERCVTSRLEFVLVCVILLRQLGFLTRLVMSLQPIPIRTLPKKGITSGKKRLGNPAKIQKKIKETDKTDSNTLEKDKPTQKCVRERPIKTERVKPSAKSKAVSVTDAVSSQNQEKEEKAGTSSEKGGSDMKKGGTKIKKGHTSMEEAGTSVKNLNNDNKNRVKVRKKGNEGTVEKQEVNNNRLKAKNKSRRSCASKIRPNAYIEDKDACDIDEEDSREDYTPAKDENANVDDDDGSDDNSDSDVTDEIMAVKKERLNMKDIESSDNEFAEKTFKLRTQSLKRLSPPQKNKKVLSSDSGETTGASSGADEWIEVYLQREKKWICVDCVTGRVNKPWDDIAYNATPPIHYVVGFSEDGTIKDVTARYASEWLTTTRKFRADEAWWAETMGLYRPLDKEMDEMENREIQKFHLYRPLPTNFAAFKNHPLYALKRHLLKFEAIYPETAVPLGYVRGEPVYARECVHVLHSRENWLKEGRAVRVGEEPYKHVKSRPKWNKPKENPDALDLEVFGLWQTEVYIPPPAVDGKVPRNAHGNVELFLPSMLPAGTVHLQIEGLNKIAKKLDIDCAPAMVGWDHHCGFSHPRMDGWIVCEEFKDILLAAWDEEQEIIREKEQEKREKRVYANWKLLIKGLLIKERLKKRFDLEEEDKAGGKEISISDTAGEAKEKANDYKHSWPQNRQTSSSSTNQKHFHIEEM